MKKPGSVFAEADATGPWSTSLGARAPVLAVQHLLLLKQVENSSQGASEN